jgi:pyruvate/2-oxoglutarate/acetoin dehydrogenase E1 component
MEIGKAMVRRQGTDACVIAYGSSVNEALAAAELLAEEGIKITVVDARFCKPLDIDMVRAAPAAVTCMHRGGYCCAVPQAAAAAAAAQRML